MNSSLMKHNGGLCQICYDTIDDTNKFSLSCGHTFCKNDWREYLIKKVDQDSTGIDARCMQAGCNLKVGHTVFEKLLPSSKLETYWKWLCKSYTDDNKRIKWCPAQGCEMCYEKSIYSTITEVRCDCGGSFCFQCGSESHKPADCEMAQQWDEKNSSESENLQWIMANTKACPACKKPIEKNQGCNHMTCATCKHEFCWICLASWKEHGSATGGYYKCNKFEELQKND